MVSIVIRSRLEGSPSLIRRHVFIESSRQILLRIKEIRKVCHSSLELRSCQICACRRRTIELRHVGDGHDIADMDDRGGDDSRSYEYCCNQFVQHLGDSVFHLRRCFVRYEWCCGDARGKNEAAEASKGARQSGEPKAAGLVDGASWECTSLSRTRESL